MKTIHKASACLSLKRPLNAVFWWVKDNSRSGSIRRRSKETNTQPTLLPAEERPRWQTLRLLLLQARYWLQTPQRKWYQLAWRISIAREDNPIGNVHNSPAPPEEQFQNPCVWILEAYPPSKIESLLSALENKGLDKPRNYKGPIIGDHDTVRDFIRSARQGSSGDYWFPLRRIIPPLSPRTSEYPKPLRRRLPRGVSSVDMLLCSKTPSVTFLLIQFFYDRQSTLAFDDAIKRNRRRSWLIRFISAHHPYDRRREVSKLRYDLRKRCIKWIGKNFPGAFTSGVADGIFPTAEILTTEILKPEERSPQRPPYAFSAALMNGNERWESVNMPGLFLAEEGMFKEDRGNLLFSGNRQILYNNPIYGHETGDYRNNPRLFSYRLAEELQNMLVLWGVSRLLLGYYSSSGRTRDELVSHKTPRLYGRLRKMRQLLVSSFDARTVAAEVRRQKLSASPYNSLIWGIPTFRRYPDSPLPIEARKLGLETLQGTWRNNVFGLADLVDDEAKMTMENLGIETGLRSTLANLWLQASVVVFSCTTIFVAIAITKHWFGL